MGTLPSSITGRGLVAHYVGMLSPCTPSLYNHVGLIGNWSEKRKNCSLWGKIWPRLIQCSVLTKPGKYDASHQEMCRDNGCLGAIIGFEAKESATNPFRFDPWSTRRPINATGKWWRVHMKICKSPDRTRKTGHVAGEWGNILGQYSVAAMKFHARATWRWGLASGLQDLPHVMAIPLRAIRCCATWTAWRGQACKSTFTSPSMWQGVMRPYRNICAALRIYEIGSSFRKARS